MSNQNRMKLTDNWTSSPTEFIQDFINGIRVQREALDFIKEHQLWKGFWSYGWVARLLTLMGIIAGAKLFSVFNGWWNRAHLDSVDGVAQSLFSLVSNVYHEGYNFLFASSFKYLIFIFMEILVFHFMRRTMEIKTGKEIHSGVNAFIKAEIRMIKVVFFTWVVEMILSLLIKIALSILGLTAFKWAILMVVQCYFLGFIVIDNYNELYGMSIRLSEYFTRQYVGIVLAIGLTTYMLLLIPIVGPVVAPFIAAVSAAIIMHRQIAIDGLPESIPLGEDEFV